MYASNTYVIRMATADDDLTLRRLAQLDSKAPLGGPVLLGEIAGTPVAALGISDGRVIADPFIPTAHLLASLRVRAKGIRAVERTPVLRERLRAGVPARLLPGAAGRGA
jgi:hypothetical protein